MAKRRSDDWLGDELLPRITSKRAIGITIFWFAIWQIAGGGDWTLFGLMFAWAGSLGLFGGDKNKGDFYDDDYDDDKRGYPKAFGRESDESARARQDGEPVALAPQSAPLHRQVIADAAPARMRLEAAASVGEGPLGARLRNMLARVKEVESGLEADPSRLSDVQRLFTYYLPATADLLTARGGMAGSGDAARLSEIDTMIGKLDLAYTDFADRLRGHDSRSLEIDLRLLDRALDEEFLVKTKG